MFINMLSIGVLLFSVLLSECSGAIITTKKAHASAPGYVSDGCDWQGSRSPNSDSERSVVPIYLRCSQGNIKWFYPKGGLRVMLKLGTGNKDFHGCIRVARNTSRNVRIYIEGKKQLYQIFAHDDGKHEDLLRCFESVNAFMALFIETQPGLYPQDPVIFSYDLQAVNHTSLYEDYEDCKPCLDDQILSMFCSADFVLSGRSTFFRSRPEVDLTEFTIKPSYIYRFPVHNSYINDFNASSVQNFYENNLIEDFSQISKVTLNRPLKCNSRAGPETEYLFLGREILGNFFITCAPKLSHWKQLSKKAIQSGQNQCHIIQEA